MRLVFREHEPSEEFSKQTEGDERFKRRFVEFRIKKHGLLSDHLLNFHEIVVYAFEHPCNFRSTLIRIEYQIPFEIKITI